MSSENQVVNIVCAFVGLDRFEVGHVSDDAIFIENSIRAVYISRLASNF